MSATRKNEINPSKSTTNLVVAMVGSVEKVGNIRRRFCQDKYEELYFTRSNDRFGHIQQLEYQNRVFSLRLWEISEDLTILDNTQWGKADVGMIVIDITDKSSYVKVKERYLALKKRLKTDCIILVGAGLEKKERREFEKQSAENLAKQLDIEYIECNAKTGANINKIFSHICIRHTKTHSKSRDPIKLLGKPLFNDSMMSKDDWGRLYNKLLNEFTGLINTYKNSFWVAQERVNKANFLVEQLTNEIPSKKLEPKQFVQLFMGAIIKTKNIIDSEVSGNGFLASLGFQQRLSTLLGNFLGKYGYLTGNRYSQALKLYNDTFPQKVKEKEVKNEGVKVKLNFK